MKIVEIMLLVVALIMLCMLLVVLVAVFMVMVPFALLGSFLTDGLCWKRKIQKLFSTLQHRPVLPWARELKRGSGTSVTMLLHSLC